jgi:hypothetical protein
MGVAVAEHGPPGRAQHRKRQRIRRRAGGHQIDRRLGRLEQGADLVARRAMIASFP